MATNGSEEINETIEVTLDLNNHLVIDFTITGSNYISGEDHSEWSIKNSDTDFPLNDINRYGFASGTDVGNFVGEIDYESIYPSEGNSVTVTLTGINYDEDSDLEIEFSELEEN